MREHSDSPASGAVPRRYTFRKAERLCARRLIEPLFQSGRAFNTYPLRFVYGQIAAGTGVSDNTIGPVPKSAGAGPPEPAPAGAAAQPPAPGVVQVLLNVSKRQFKRAHDRNRIKRQLREAWRHEKARLQPAPAGTSLLVAVLYIGREKPESLAFLARRLRKGLDRLLAELPPPEPPSPA